MAVMDHPLTVVERAYRAWRRRTSSSSAPLTRRSAGTRRTGFYAGDYIGRDQVAQLLRDLLSDFGRFEIKPIKFAAYEDMVAVLRTYEGVGKVTGFEFEDRFIHLWKVNDGRAEWMGLYRESGPAFRDLDRLTGVARSGDFAQPPSRPRSRPRRRRGPLATSRSLLRTP